MEYRALSEQEYNDLSERILYEDNHLLVVNKRPGEIVQGDKTGDEPLSEKYKALIAMRTGKPGKVFLGVPHRIDRPVGGICIFAKTSKALERLAEMFREGKVHKTYWALVQNVPPQPEGELRHWLVRDGRLNKSFVCKGDPDGPAPRNDARLARLMYKTSGNTERYHLVEVELLTGRHHQIRCQLAAIGCPIKGDLKYGAQRSNPDGSICLLARHVSLVHPVRQTLLELTAPLPPSWPAVLF